MDLRHEIERWFAARGVPQLIAGFSTEQRMDQRALPFIAAWIVIGSLLVWGRPLTGAAGEQVLGTVIALLATVGVLAAIFFVRRRPPFGTNRRLDLLDIALIGLVPGTAAAVVHRDALSVLGVGGYVLLGVGFIYLVVGFGLLEVGWWALRHLRAQMAQISQLVARTLPVLLILVVFLLFASELWQAAHTLSGADLGAIVALLMLVASVLVVTRASAEVAAIESELRPATVISHLAGTPAAPLAADVGPVPVRRLSLPERLNVLFLMLVSQLVQSLFVGLLVLLFLVALGVLAVPESVQELWVGDGVRPVLAFDFLGEARLVSSELLLTAGLLGGVCALYFTGLALTDAAFRAEFHARVVGEVEQIIAVHAAYLASPELHGAGEEAAARGESAIGPS